MQSIAGYPTDLTATEPSALVTVNGTPQDVSSVKVTRELADSSASGITAATGSVEWAVGEDVATRSAHPWEGNIFPPKPADEVEVSIGYGSALARQLTGVVDSSSGSMGDGSVSSDLVDPIDKLNRPVDFPAHMIVLPPWDDGGQFLAANNTPLFTTDRVLRACGFNATPPAAPGAVMSAPLMGSAWPEIGKLTFAGQVANLDFPPSFSATQWGIGANSIVAEYFPIMSGSGTNRIDNKVMQITAKVRDVDPGDDAIEVAVWWGNHSIRLRVSSTRSIQAVYGDGVAAPVYVASMTAPAAATADVFTVRINSSGNYTIYANNGANATGTLALPDEIKTTNITKITIIGEHLSSAHIGGVQVGFYTHNTWEAPTTAILTPPAFGGGLPAMPAIKGRVALDVLKEQASAECAAMWIDEFGVFRWVNRDLLESSAPVATLTALDDLLDISWDSDTKQVRSGVVVNSREAKITRMPFSSVTLYTGSGETLQPGETTVDIAEAGADESWFNVDLVGGTHTHYNQGQRSMWGGVIVKDGNPEIWAFDVGALPVTLELLKPDKVLVSHTATTALATGETIVLKTPETDPFLKPFREDKPLPIIRGKARVRWTDITTASTITGPPNASVLEHDAGPWVQDPDELQELADWMAAKVTAAAPTLRDIPVVPDPRRQLADVVWVEAPEHMHVRLKVLVTGISLSTSAGAMQQTISGRILEVQSLGVTNEQLDTHAAEYTNESFDTLWADATNAALDADPLERG